MMFLYPHKNIIRTSKNIKGLHLNDTDFLRHSVGENSHLFSNYCHLSHTRDWALQWLQLTDAIVDEIVGRKTGRLFLRAKCLEVLSLPSLQLPFFTELLHRDEEHHQATGRNLLETEPLLSMLNSATGWALLLDSTTPEACSRIRSEFLDLMELATDMREIAAIEEVLRGMHRCYMARLDRVAAFASLLSAAERRDPQILMQDFKHTSQLLIAAIDALLETARHLEKIAHLHYFGPPGLSLSSPNRYTEHTARRLVSALEFLGRLPVHDHESGFPQLASVRLQAKITRLLPDIRKVLGLESASPFNSPAITSPNAGPMDPVQAAGHLSSLMLRLRGRYDITTHQKLALLLQRRAGSYPREASQDAPISYRRWLVCGWNITKTGMAEGTLISGLFALPTPLQWHRNARTHGRTHGRMRARARARICSRTHARTHAGTRRGYTGTTAAPNTLTALPSRLQARAAKLWLPLCRHKRAYRMVSTIG